MEKLLIVKLGMTYPSIRRVAGDFDDMVVAKTGVSAREVTVCSVYEGQPLPDISGIFAVIMTGSHAMVTKRADWSVYLEQWLREKAYNRVPVLGICYAHQLIAMALGGQADYHPGGMELGTTGICLTREGMQDPLMKGLPQEFKVQVAHAQTVTALPREGKVLAGNSFEKHHAIAVGGMTWGLQFHPEFDAEIVNMYIEEDKDWLTGKGYDVRSMHNTVEDSPCGGIILKRFVELASQRA